MQDQKFIPIPTPSPNTKIKKIQPINFDSDIIDKAYNVVENIFADTNLNQKMISFDLNPKEERVYLIKNLSNLEQYLIDFNHRLKMLRDRDQEIFLIDDLPLKEEQIEFANFLREYQQIIKFRFDNFKNNFKDGKINIFISHTEFELREKNRANFYKYNSNRIWFCKMPKSLSTNRVI